MQDNAAGTSQPQSYTLTARVLHWPVALLIFGAYGLGWTMTSLDISPLKVKMFNWHKWTGITILTLVFVRLLWRLTHRPPPLLPMPRWQGIAAHGLHGMLYALMFAVPLSGWAYSNATGYPIVYLGLLRLPNLVDKNKLLAENLEKLHGLLGFVTLLLVVGHVLVALQHHFIARDGTLRRMLR